MPARLDVIAQLENEMTDAIHNLDFWRKMSAIADPEMDQGTVANLIDHAQLRIKQIEAAQQIFQA